VSFQKRFNDNPSITYYDAADQNRNTNSQQSTAASNHGPSHQFNFNNESMLRMQHDAQLSQRKNQQLDSRMGQESGELNDQYENRATLPHVLDFKMRQEAYERLKNQDELKSNAPSRNITDQSDNDLVSSNRQLQRQKQEQYAREVALSSSQQPIELPRQSLIRQNYAGTGLPGDYRADPVLPAALSNSYRIRGTSSGGGQSSISIGYSNDSGRTTSNSGLNRVLGIDGVYDYAPNQQRTRR
jgi:hypothetical protein